MEIGARTEARLGARPARVSTQLVVPASPCVHVAFHPLDESQGLSSQVLCNHETVQIEPWGRDSLRVRSTISAGIRNDLLSVLLPPAETEAQITIGAEGATIRNGAITASVSPEGSIRFSNTASGTELLAEESPVRATRLPPRSFKAVHSELFHLEVRFRAYNDERLCGLGQHQHGRLDQKGCTVDLIQRNTEVSIPFLFSSQGYGFRWHNPGIGRVELGYNGTHWVAEATPQLEYWITVGATPAEIMEHYADATGHAPEFPAWAAGFWQSKLRYRTQDELLSVARGREVYLPTGTSWSDAWSGQNFEGGRHIVAEAPLERIPLYLRANSRLPIGKA